MSSSLPAFGPAYDPAEAMEILRLAAAVSAFVPRFNPGSKFSLFDPHAPAAESPIQSTVPVPGPYPAMPSLFPHRWPTGWVAGVQRGKNPTWEKSLVLSWGKYFANQAMLAYNPVADAYCLSFRGTMTAGNALEDLLAVMVPAGPVDAPTAAEFLHKFPKWHVPEVITELMSLFTGSDRAYCPQNIPGVSERAYVHAGFRVAVESLDFAAVRPDAPHGIIDRLVEHALANKLTRMLEEVGHNAGGRPIKIYVTGHSLGAGMASLVAGWLQTQPIKGAAFQVKCYAFAQPKPGNDYFSYAQGVSFGNGWVYAVINSLDTIPQVGLTLQNIEALNYQDCIAFLADKLGLIVDLAREIPRFNFVHMGQEIILRGEAVVAGQTPQQDGFYNLPAAPADAAEAAEKKKQGLLSDLIHLGKKPAPTPKPAADYYHPAYLLLAAQPEMANDYFPPPSTWTVFPYEGAPDPSLGQFAPLWQHMPWTYMQALARDLKRG